jgi:uncharacterized protein DUF4350
MPGKRAGLLWMLAALLVAVFCWGAWQTLTVPVESGTAYPPFSSLRTDPQGSKALYDSLAELPDVSVERLYTNPAPIEAGSVLLRLGVSSYALGGATDKSLGEYDKLLAQGGRLAVTFEPTGPRTDPPKFEAVEKAWKIHPRFREPEPSQAAADDSEPDPRETALYFEGGPEWRTLTERDGRASAVERPLGGGTLVLVADSFPLLNQGLQEPGASALIAKIIGPARHIVFDEDQFGITNSGGVVVLMEKYHLQAAVLMLLALAGLYLWRLSASFLPRRELPRGQSISGRDSHEGLAALLRRAVSEKNLLQTCQSEYRRTNPPGFRRNIVESELQRWAGGDPVEAYRAVCRALAEHK